MSANLTDAEAAALIAKFKPDLMPHLDKMAKAELHDIAGRIHANWVAPIPNYIPELPEHDPELFPLIRPALNLTEMLCPSVDNLTRRPEPDAHVQRTEWTVRITDAAPGRCDPSLAKTVFGPIDQIFNEIGEANTRRRVNVHVELDTSQVPAIVAMCNGLPPTMTAYLSHIGSVYGFPLAPSLVITTRGEDKYKPLLQLLWLTSSELSAAQHAAVSRVLTERHSAAVAGRGEKVLFALPGTFNRTDKPYLVRFQGGSDQGTGAPKYPVGDIMNTLGAVVT